MKPERLVIVDGVRTPFCKMGTELARLGADELGRIAVRRRADRRPGSIGMAKERAALGIELVDRDAGAVV